MRRFKVILSSLLFLVIIASFSSCSKSYPCPGVNAVNPADISAFDENGDVKTKGKKKKKDNGLVSKKSPKKIRRRTNLRLE